MKNELKLTILGNLQTLLIGSEYVSIGGMENLLTHFVGEPIKYYDTQIDDGIDDDVEDNLLMRDCFSSDDDSLIIRIYYGNNSKKIGCVNIS
jgi:hypothetical protein